MIIKYRYKDVFLQQFICMSAICPAKFMACTGQKISSPDKTKQNIETFRPCIFLFSLQKAYSCTPSTMKAR